MGDALSVPFILSWSPSICDLGSVALCLIGYAGFFRFSEYICHIKACDVKFFPSYVSIFLESWKCDQFRDGAWIVIARTDLPTCLVKALEDYISAAQINLSEDLPLFRALATPRSKEKVRSQGISYTRARERIKDAFRDIKDVSKIIALGLEEPPLPLMPVSLIDFSSDMAVGRATTPRMATLRTLSSTDPN